MTDARSIHIKGGMLDGEVVSDLVEFREGDPMFPPLPTSRIHFLWREGGSICAYECLMTPRVERDEDGNEIWEAL